MNSTNINYHLYTVQPRLEFFRPGCDDIVIESGREEVEQLEAADDADAHAEAEEAADVGDEVNGRVHLVPLRLQEVQAVEVDVRHDHVLRDVGVVQELGMVLWRSGLTELL